MSEMTSEREARILQAAVDGYGAIAQTDMMIEEMSELTKALLKYRRSGANGTLEESDLDAVLDGMADVGIMLNQMRLIYGDPTERKMLLDGLTRGLDLSKANRRFKEVDDG